MTRRRDPMIAAVDQALRLASGPRKPRRCCACERATRLCGVLVGGYCADCRQLPLPFRAATERATRGEKPSPLGPCDLCDRRAHCRLPSGARCLRHLDAEPLPELPRSARSRPPTMIELGWSCTRTGERWTHRSGATVEFRGSFPMGNRAARVNGGEWEPISEMFYVTIRRALREFQAASESERVSQASNGQPQVMVDAAPPPSAAAQLDQTPAGVGTLQRRRRRQGGAEASATTPQLAADAPLSAPRARRDADPVVALVGRGTMPRGRG